MKLFGYAALVCALSLAAPRDASAHGRHHHRHHRHHAAAVVGDVRPHAWCGWFMRHLESVSDRAYNLARNWTRWGAPAGGPRVGAIVVWPHHVGKIVGDQDQRGRWLVLSGNDGHAVRTRYRSVSGAIGFRVASL